MIDANTVQKRCGPIRKCSLNLDGERSLPMSGTVTAFERALNLVLENPETPITVSIVGPEGKLSLPVEDVLAVLTELHILRNRTGISFAIKDPVADLIPPSIELPPPLPQGIGRNEGDIYGLIYSSCDLSRVILYRFCKIDDEFSCFIVRSRALNGTELLIAPYSAKYDEEFFLDRVAPDLGRARFREMSLAILLVRHLVSSHLRGGTVESPLAITLLLADLVNSGFLFWVCRPENLTGWQDFFRVNRERLLENPQRFLDDLLFPGEFDSSSTDRTEARLRGTQEEKRTRA